MPGRPISIDRYIQSGKSIPVSMLRQIYEYSQILGIMRRILPESLGEFLLGCVRKQTELILLTGSSAAAAKLRFYSTVILQTLNAGAQINVKAVKIRIVPPAKATPRRRPGHKVPSLETIRALRECGEYFSGTDLARSLNRLANTLDRANWK